MENIITPLFLIQGMIMTIGIFALTKWVCWSIINETEIVETIGILITRFEHDKAYYIEKCNKLFENVKTILIIFWIAIPTIHLFFLGMKVVGK